MQRAVGVPLETTAWRNNELESRPMELRKGIVESEDISSLAKPLTTYPNCLC